MSNGKNPLMLMMALAMPGAASAIGLGDIHVDSALNERLAAEIDIVGATAADLSDLRAAVANRETFLHYGADRPAFLSSATFKVTQDSRGRPVLAVRSTEAFSEPLVNFLVDLRWHNGELVRQYTLLLDPPGFAAASRVAEAATSPAPMSPDVPAASPVATPIVETKTQTVARQIDPPSDLPKPTSAERAARKTTHVKVGPKATLRGVAWRVGERSETDLQKMMIAIFRANPSAFDGNINRLHLGAVLTIPSYAEVAAITNAEAKLEIHAQMAAWHAPLRMRLASAAPAKADSTAVVASPVTSVTAATPAATTPTLAPATVATATAESLNAEASPNEALDRRVQSLEHELVELKGVLETQQDKLVGMRKQVEQAENTQSAAIPKPANESAPSENTQSAVKSAPSEEAAAAGTPAAETQTAETASSKTADAPTQEVTATHRPIVPIVAGIGLLGAALAALYFRFRRRTPNAYDWRVAAAAAAVDEAPVAEARIAQDKVDESHAITHPNLPDTSRTGAFADANAHVYSEAPVESSKSTPSDTQETAAPIFDEDTHPLLPVLSAGAPIKRANNAAATISQPDPEESTVNMRADQATIRIDAGRMEAVRAEAARVDATRVDATRLDYNLVDLDMTVQHVQMPSVLNEHAVVKERRTNLADALKLAIEREPDRHDLRMKLLELYYSAASTNRQAFLEVVQKFARDRDHLQSDQWDKIAFMGRQIAADNPMFIEELVDDDLADCA